MTIKLQLLGQQIFALVNEAHTSCFNNSSDRCSLPGACTFLKSNTLIYFTYRSLHLDDARRQTDLWRIHVLRLWALLAQYLIQSADFDSYTSLINHLLVAYLNWVRGGRDLGRLRVCRRKNKCKWQRTKITFKVINTQNQCVCKLFLGLVLACTSEGAIYFYLCRLVYVRLYAHAMPKRKGGRKISWWVFELTCVYPHM